MPRWGLLGTGVIARKTATAIGMSGGSVIGAIAGHDPELHAAFQRAYNIPVARAGVDDVLSDPDIDAICIGFPQKRPPHTDDPRCGRGPFAPSQRLVRNHGGSAGMGTTRLGNDRTGAIWPASGTGNVIP